MGDISSTASRPKRLHTITPPPAVPGWPRVVASLEEAGAELAVVFWRVLRRVHTWVRTPPEERARLYGSGEQEARERLGQGCVHAPALVEAFGVFAQMVRAPEGVEPRQVAEACRQVHAWAEERSLMKVGMLFAEAAAMADPDNPARANDAGRMCRRAACDDRAASWYHRGFGLAVRHKARQETIRALLGYGNLMKDLGQHDEARRYFERAAQRAISTGRQRQAAEAHHDLLLMSTEIGTYSQAERHARLAVRLYPLQHPRIPHFVHDFTLLLVLRRYYSRALPLLNKLLKTLERPDESLLVWGTLARAAAGAGQRRRFAEAEQKVVQLADSFEEFSPAAFIHLAEGARTVGEWTRAEKYTAEAVERARRRRNKVAERVGLELMEKISARELSPPEQEPEDRDRMEALILRIATRLRIWKAPGRKPPEALIEVPVADSQV
ncbi:MAG TPA: tetratricopeptide repeat protein [Longimicrobiaceae bacterium]|nr:tetratricopeptide repeat protein [Longimicrobiaceae bacterium]